MSEGMMPMFDEPKIQHIYGGARRLVALVDEVTDAARGQTTLDPMQLVSIGFMTRARNCLAAVCDLMVHRHVAEAFSAVRTVLELDIELAFMLSERSRLQERFIAWETFGAIHAMRRVRALDDRVPADVRENVARAYNEALLFFGIQPGTKNKDGTDKEPRGWWTEDEHDTLKKRARAGARSDVYRLAYGHCCGYSHATKESWADANQLVKTPNGAALLVRVGEAEPRALPIAYGAASLAHVIGVVVVYCKLKCIESRVSEVVKEISKPPGQGEPGQSRS